MQRLARLEFFGVQEDTAGLMDVDAELEMDVDAMPDDAAAELNTRATKSLEGPGLAGDQCCKNCCLNRVLALCVV